MAAAAPTPPQETTEGTAPATIDLSTIPYNEDFENAMMNTILDSSRRHSSSAAPDEPSTDSADLPNIPFADLPLPLTDSRRKFRSPLPGISLTHPGGLFEGGPGPTAAVSDAWTSEFVGQRNVRSARQFKRAVDDQMDFVVTELRRRMVKRQEAIDNNEALEKELESLKAQRQVEVKILERARAQTLLRKEQKKRSQEGE